MDSSRAVVMKSVSKMVTPPTSGLIRREEALHFLGLSGDEDDDDDDDGDDVDLWEFICGSDLSRFWRRNRREVDSLVCGTEQNYQAFCTEVANYEHAKTREFAHGVSAREGRACKREYKAIARRQPVIEIRGGLRGLYRSRLQAVRTRATDDFKDGPLPGTRVPVGQEALVAYVDPPVEGAVHGRREREDDSEVGGHMRRIVKKKSKYRDNVRV